MSCEQDQHAEENAKPMCPFTTEGVYVSFFLRFCHMLTHIPLGFGDFGWAIRLHDITGDAWEEYEAAGSGLGRAPTIQTIMRLVRASGRGGQK